MTEIVHHMVCRQRVEVEVWPAQAELNFQDERWVNPINTQVRFEAIVYNSMSGVDWEVRAVDGSPGLGTVDATGLYQASPKGTLASGTTELVVAVAREDPLRRAFAWVTLVGEGPEPAPSPTIEVWPSRVNLYYPVGFDNAYMDDSNTMRLFEASPRHAPGAAVEWLVDGALQPVVDPWFLYRVAGGGGTQLVTIRARIQGQPAVFGDAKVLQLNYQWPGL